jgi:ABC-type transport system involved in cytochrome c biogenesis permease component
MWTAAAFIARKDLTYMLRQKETILWVFAMPILFFYFIGTVTAGFGSPAGSAERPDPLALRAPAASGFLVDEVVRRLEEQRFRVVRPATPDEFDGYARRLTVPAPPAGHESVTDAVIAGQDLVLTFERRGDPLAATFDRVRVSRAVYTVLADLTVVKNSGETPTAAAFARLAAMPRALTLDVRTAGRRRDPPTGFSQAIPGTMVMFTMLVLLTSGAIMLVVERDQGLLRRLASTPISPGAIVLGKWTARMALALVQVGFAMAVGRVLFGMDWGASVAMVVVVLVAWAAFNASLALLLGSLARTPGQMAGLGVLATMVLAALGGCWWPIEITPSWMQSLAMALPTGWTMDALHRLVNFGYGPGAAVPHVAGLGLAALAAGWAGARVFRYQ